MKKKTFEDANAQAASVEEESTPTEIPFHYLRPKDDSEALQVAIEKWIRFQYHIWEETKKQPLRFLDLSSTLLRIAIIALSASITTMSDIDAIPRTTITIVGGILTILAGTEGYLKLADRKAAGENRRQELLAERDKWGYKWMVEVELQTDTAKALKTAKELLKTAPQSVNDLLSKYMQREPGKPATKPP